MNIGERIKKLRKSLDLTQQKFGQQIGIKGNTVAQYELGRNEPIDAVLSLICREFNVREEWLRTGEGEIFKPKPTDILDELAYKYQLSNSDYVMIEKFLSLRPTIRKEFFNYFQEVTSALEEMEPESPAYSDNHVPRSMDSIIKSHLKNNPNETPEPTTKDLEAAYKKSRSSSVRKTATSASNITKDAEYQNDITKAINQ